MHPRPHRIDPDRTPETGAGSVQSATSASGEQLQACLQSRNRHQKADPALIGEIGTYRVILVANRSRKSTLLGRVKGGLGSRHLAPRRKSAVSSFWREA